VKIFLSYGHDSNAPFIEKIKEYLSKDADGNLKHEVWIDTSEIKAEKDWLEKEGLRIYPMSIEPRAELPGDMKNYYHFGKI